MWNINSIYLSLAIAVGVLVLACTLYRRSRSTSDRSAIRWVGAAAMVAVWLSPCTQSPLSLHAQEELLERVMAYKGQPVSELAVALGEPEINSIGTPYYVSRPWYAPVGAHWSVELYLHDGDLFTARIDD